MKYIAFLPIAFSLLFTSCFTEELPVEPHQSGEVESGIAVLRDNYMNQVFYDLTTNTSVRSNVITDWDLGFEASDTGWRVIINNSRFMHAGNSGNTVFEDVVSDDGLVMKFDRSDGNPDSTAVGNWLNISGEDTLYSGHVYVIDMGYNELFQQLGYKKIIFQNLQNNTYSIRYADLTGENEQNILIEKDNTKNYVCFSFENGVVDIEPSKNSWTLKFTKYSTMLLTNEGDLYPYSVLGVLLNPYNVKASIDTLKAFDQLILADTVNYVFSDISDYIGYEWKYYNFEAGVYTIVPDINYLIKNYDGFYYKFRFIDFYSYDPETIGEKGFPTFEFVRL